MSSKKYRVILTAEEKAELEQLVSRGVSAARKQVRARILLLSDENATGGAKKDSQISSVLGVSISTIERVRERFVNEGFRASLEPRQRSGTKPRKLDGEAEAFLVATACSEAPEGRANWTMKLLADKLVECKYVDCISDETVRKTLKKTFSSPG